MGVKRIRIVDGDQHANVQITCQDRQNQQSQKHFRDPGTLESKRGKGEPGRKEFTSRIDHQKRKDHTQEQLNGKKPDRVIYPAHEMKELENQHIQRGSTKKKGDDELTERELIRKTRHANQRQKNVDG